LKQSTATLMAAPGPTAVHHAACQTVRVYSGILPPIGLAALETPRPRKLIVGV